MLRLNVVVDFFLWRVEIFKIGKRDVTFIRETRVDRLVLILNSKADYLAFFLFSSQLKAQKVQNVVSNLNSS